ncbi:MAG: transporter [Venatoribacter sp.]
MLFRATLLTLPFLIVAAPLASADDYSEARNALSKQDSDADTEKALEQVFQAAEKNYSLLRRGDAALNYNFDYSYYGDQRIDLLIQPVVDEDGNSLGKSQIYNADVSQVANHTYTNSFTLDYGVLNNLTISGRLPLVAKYDTEEDITSFGMGDISTTLRWQPFEYVPGNVSQTYFGSVSLKTGDSPYEIDLDRHLSTGAGYYSITAGGSFSKVMDPVVLFGSASLSYNIKESGLNQVRGASILKEIDPGNTLSFAMGFAYSLSYDVSLSASFQGSYNDETSFKVYIPADDATRKSVTGSQMSGIMNFALGVRVSPKTIANVNVGFGLTELSPDIILGLSLPIDIEGIKPSGRR